MYNDVYLNHVKYRLEISLLVASASRIEPLLC